VSVGIQQPSHTGQREICPSCGGVLIAKCGQIVVNHWAHEAETACEWAAESDWHRRGKIALADAMGGCVEFACGDRRADVYVEHDYGEPPLVIELQHSSTTAKEVESRNRDWSPAQVLWVWDARSWRVEPCRHMGRPPGDFGGFGVAAPTPGTVSRAAELVRRTAICAELGGRFPDATRAIRVLGGRMSRIASRTPVSLADFGEFGVWFLIAPTPAHRSGTLYRAVRFPLGLPLGDRDPSHRWKDGAGVLSSLRDARDALCA
jgi:hypothetical protein